MYADKMTDSMRRAIDETNRRRADAGSVQRRSTASCPQSIVKAVRDLTQRIAAGSSRPQRLAIAEGRP